jgi:hypothetical protein
MPLDTGILTHVARSLTEPTAWACIREVLGSSLSRNTDYLYRGFGAFVQSLQREAAACRV